MRTEILISQYEIDDKSIETEEDKTLDAIYSYYCLKTNCYYDYSDDCFYTIPFEEIVPKYCKAFGRKYIIEKIMRVLKKNGISQRHS
jgi:hypothetical protein